MIEWYMQELLQNCQERFSATGVVILCMKKHAFGLPTEYVLTHPHMVVYVNKPASNTNQKMDGHIGGELFAVLVDQHNIGAIGLVVDNHFTVLVFTAGTGKPIMVAVILKSEQAQDKIPAI
jgi:hypothetical protein